jgi:hypothetical protein
VGWEYNELISFERTKEFNAQQSIFWIGTSGAFGGEGDSSRQTGSDS